MKMQNTGEVMMSKIQNMFFFFFLNVTEYVI